MRIECKPGIGRQQYLLYKEQAVIGRAEVSGGQLQQLEILPEWRSRGYGSYLLKEVLRAGGGFDTAAETRFTAPLPDPANRAAWALARRFGFVRRGEVLCRHRLPDLTAVQLAQHLLTDLLQPGGLYIDATCGNGHDTLFLCRLAGAQGHVIGLDIQPMAVQATNTLLAQNGMDAHRAGDPGRPPGPAAVRAGGLGGLRDVQLWLAAGRGPRGAQPGRGVGGGGAGGAGGAETRRGAERRCCTAARSSAAAKSRRCWTTWRASAAGAVHGAGLPVCQLGRDRAPALPGHQAPRHPISRTACSGRRKRKRMASLRIKRRLPEQQAAAHKMV